MKRSSTTSSKHSIKVTWFGHSAFLLESPDGKAVLIDPWLDNPKAPPEAKDIPNVDLILVSHGHSDHVGNTVEIAKRTNAKVVCIYELYLYFQSQGVTTAQGMNKGSTVEIDGVKLTMVDARHSSDIDIGGSVVPGGEAAGFVVEFANGFSIYHAGDTAVFGDMKLIQQLYKPKLVLLPIGGFYTMGPREAALACKLLHPQHIMGMHYGTFPVLTGTLSELKKYLPAAMKRKVIEMAPGEVISLG